MSFASDKLYKGYLRRKMPMIASKVKVREIMAHLPCLTDHDRENIEAKRETYGNHDSMVLLLDCLKRRENWPEQFIAGLEACEQTTLAAEVQAEYDALRGINPPAPAPAPSPSSPPTTVIRAHVHPAPPAVAASEAAPAEPDARPSPPLVPVQPQAPLNPAAQVPVAVSPPEPVAEPPQPAQIEVAAPPSTPPPSPEAPHTQATPPPQREVNSHQEPVENSESDIQDVLAANGAIPAPVNAGNGEVSISSEVSIDSVAAPPPSGPVEQCETDTPSCPDPLQTTTTTTTAATAADVTPPQSPPPSLTDSDVSDGSSFLTLTPVKPPVQDTTPPLDTKPAAVPQPEETTEPPAAQVVESSPQVEAAAPAPPLPVAAGTNASLWDDDDDDSVCLSKPGQLVSVPPQNHGGPAHPEPAAAEEPFSGDSGRLEMSEAPATSTLGPACSAVSSVVSSAVSANTNSELPCQENGISLNHNEPEENQYDSPCQSFDVRENVVQISEEPSILNLDGQSSALQAQSVNGEAAKEITSVLPPLPTNTVDIVLSATTASNENHHPCQPAPADVSSELKSLQESEEKTTPSRNLPANTKYFLTAAGVGACALLMAWKFKN